MGWAGLRGVAALSRCATPSTAIAAYRCPLQCRSTPAEPSHTTASLLHSDIAAPAPPLPLPPPLPARRGVQGPVQDLFLLALLSHSPAQHLTHPHAPSTRKPSTSANVRTLRGVLRRCLYSSCQLPPVAVPGGAALQARMPFPASIQLTCCTIGAGKPPFVVAGPVLTPDRGSWTARPPQNATADLCRLLPHTPRDPMNPLEQCKTTARATGCPHWSAPHRSPTPRRPDRVRQVGCSHNRRGGQSGRVLCWKCPS